MNDKNKQIILGISVVVLIAGGAGFYIYNDIPKENQDIVVNVAEIATTTDSISNSNKGYTVEVVPIENTNTPSIPVPDLNREVVFDENTSDDAKRIITEKIDKLVKELKENSNLFQNWMDLGLYRKSIGDYEGARDAWEYAGAISPSNSLSLRNLGDLYGYYLKDSQKAEESFLKAIENGPSQIEYYFKAVDFYRDVMNDSTRARAIVQQGITANPSSEELKSLLTNLQ